MYKSSNFLKKLLTFLSEFDIILKYSMRVCWNRQTGTFEGRVSLAYGFKSRHSHQLILQFIYARVVELADSLDSGSSVHYARAGSSPASRTMSEQAMDRLLRLILYVRARSRRCSSFPNRTSLRWASVWGRPVCGFFLVGFNRLFQI